MPNQKFKGKGYYHCIKQSFINKCLQRNVKTAFKSTAEKIPAERHAAYGYVWIEKIQTYIEEEIKAIDAFCLNLGIAFQIQDDILDVLGNEQTLGKPIGSDAENHKTTFVTLFGLEKAKEKAVAYTNMAIESLSVFRNKADTLIELANYLTNRQY